MKSKLLLLTGIVALGGNMTTRVHLPSLLVLLGLAVAAPFNGKCRCTHLQSGDGGNCC